MSISRKPFSGQQLTISLQSRVRVSLLPVRSCLHTLKRYSRLQKHPFPNNLPTFDPYSVLQSPAEVTALYPLPTSISIRIRGDQGNVSRKKETFSRPLAMTPRKGMFDDSFLGTRKRAPTTSDIYQCRPAQILLFQITWNIPPHH